MFAQHSGGACPRSVFREPVVQGWIIGHFLDEGNGPSGVDEYEGCRNEALPVGIDIGRGKRRERGREHSRGGRAIVASQTHRQIGLGPANRAGTAFVIQRGTERDGSPDRFLQASRRELFDHGKESR